jgi:hypothetical protein
LPLIGSPAVIRRATLLAAALSLSLGGCGEGAENVTPPRISVLEADVFATHCTFSSCHGAIAPRMGLSLVAPIHAAVVGVRSTEMPERQRVVPGDPTASYLFEKISSDHPAVGVRMPPGQPLPADIIQAVRRWIEDGAES